MKTKHKTADLFRGFLFMKERVSKILAVETAENFV